MYLKLYYHIYKMQYQDWNIVTFKNKKNIERKEIKNNIVTINSKTNKPIWKIEKQIDSDIGSVFKYVSREDANIIIQNRILMKLSQKDLAYKLNMPIKDIQDIESLKAIENKLTLSKIKKFLQVKI